jgi:pimeloyl-ACP methyl ester carboxylesterase
MQRRAFELQAVEGGEPIEPNPSLASHLGEIAVPTLVVTGAIDVAEFMAIGDRPAAEIPAASRETVVGASHLVSMDRQKEFLALVGQLG